MLVHLLNVDSIHHKNGPDTWAAYTAIAYADTRVHEVLTAIDDAGIRAQTTVLIVSDHGFTSTPTTLLPNVLLRKHGLLETNDTGKITQSRVHVYPEGGIGMLYLTAPESIDKDRGAVRRLFDGQEGIAEILEPAQYAAHGFPAPMANSQMADMVLVAKDGYAFGGAAEGDEFAVLSSTLNAPLGHHGFLSSNAKMNAIFVAAGCGIRPGGRLGIINNIDVAPTVARLLDLRFDSAEGRVIEEILEQPVHKSGAPGGG
jgi:predicted AlkP superfamily pyrophosphatase or phosphodiesterase